MSKYKYINEIIIGSMYVSFSFISVVKFFKSFFKKKYKYKVKKKKKVCKSLKVSRTIIITLSFLLPFLQTSIAIMTTFFVHLNSRRLLQSKCKISTFNYKSIKF